MKKRGGVGGGGRDVGSSLGGDEQAGSSQGLESGAEEQPQQGQASVDLEPTQHRQTGAGCGASLRSTWTHRTAMFMGLLSTRHSAWGKRIWRSRRMKFLTYRKNTVQPNRSFNKTELQMAEATASMRVVVKELPGWGGLRRCCYGTSNTLSSSVAMHLRNRESVLYSVSPIFFSILWLVRQNAF